MPVSTPGYNFAAEVEANRQSAANAIAQSQAQNPVNPFMYGQGNASTAMSSSSTTGGGPIGTLPARITYPSEQLQYLKGEAVNYPTYLRNLGEQMAQQAYQKRMNQSLRAGAAGQGYLASLDELNRNRLQYMGQAGQQAYDVAKGQEDAMTKLYGLDINQRGQDIDYLSAMAAIQQRQNQATMASSGGGMTIGGGSGSTRKNQTGGETGDGGVFTDITGARFKDGQFQGYNTQSDAQRSDWVANRIGGGYYSPSQPQTSQVGGSTPSRFYNSNQAGSGTSGYFSAAGW